MPHSTFGSEKFVKSIGDCNGVSAVSASAYAPTSEEGSGIYVRAIDLLSRREHSVKELCNKLNRKFPNSEADVSRVCQFLQERRYLCDERFSEAYERSRRSKGFGSSRIRQELRVKGVSDAVIEALYNSICERDTIEGSSKTFNSDLYRLWQKKFSVQPDREQRAKQVRFFLYRGFSMSEIDCLFSHLQDFDLGGEDI